jgi:hypothetical protein
VAVGSVVRAGLRSHRDPEKGGEQVLAEKNRCRVVIKKASGEECVLPVESCSDEPDGEHVIVVRCDTDAKDCCCERKD